MAAPRHTAFEWDQGKAAVNLRKHGIRFDWAADALEDTHWPVNHVEIDDDREDYGEARVVTFASVPSRRTLLLRIVWTDRGGVTRIISARRATRSERTRYENTRAKAFETDTQDE